MWADTSRYLRRTQSSHAVMSPLFFYTVGSDNWTPPRVTFCEVNDCPLTCPVKKAQSGSYCLLWSTKWAHICLFGPTWLGLASVIRRRRFLPEQSPSPRWINGSDHSASSFFFFYRRRDHRWLRNQKRGMEAAAAELERLQIEILRRISHLETSILPQNSSAPLLSRPVDESETVTRLSAVLRSGGVSDFSFKRVAPDYYDCTLESRRDVLGASSVDHLCKSIVLVL